MPRFEKGTRFYTLMLEQDLLGDWVVVTVYGRIGTSLGQVRVHAFADKPTAQDYFDAECVRRLKRGYLSASS
jgi:predicted DNA-binding WGR domain protein